MTRIVGLLDSLDLRRTAGVLIGAIVVLGILGILARWLDPGNPWFDLDSEIGPAWPLTDATLALPAVWSSITFAFGGIGWVAAGSCYPNRATRVAALGFGVILLGFAIDEMFIVHERLEARSGIDWQLIYVPVAAVTAMLLAILVWQLRDRGRGISAMLVAGGLSWALALALEYVQWRGDEEVELYDWLMVPEELLELASNALFALAAIATLQALSTTAKALASPIERGE